MADDEPTTNAPGEGPVKPKPWVGPGKAADKPKPEGSGEGASGYDDGDSRVFKNN
ncbi:MAG TPA: hypothetical protein VES42_19265 [Pilimelia sp.]|nr:hypothetical protein [Pilimelia sp.]